MRFVHDNLYPLIAAMIFIIVTSCWFGTSVPVSQVSRTLPPESWSLPKPAAKDSKKFMETINSRNLWGIVLTDAQTEPEWHVLGIARNGAERFILLAFDGKPVEMLKVGDSLPDGAKIVQIEHDRFFIMTADKKKLAFGIYKNESAK